MKKLFFLASLFLCSCQLFAQDLIVTNKGDSLNCKITNLKKDFIYFTFKHKEEIRSSLLPLNQIVSYQYSFYESPLVPADKIKSTHSYQQFSFTLKGGLSYRTAKTAELVPNDFHQYMKDLKSGYTYGADFTYYISEPIGIGLSYNAFRSSNALNNVYITTPDGITMNGKMSDDITINFIGPSFNLRLLDGARKNASLIHIGIGYLGYKNNAMLIDHYTLEGSTVGFTWGVGYDLSLSRHTALGFQLSLLGGTLNKLNVDNGKTTRTMKLEKESYESLSRVDLTVGLKFNQ